MEKLKNAKASIAIRVACFLFVGLSLLIVLFYFARPNNSSVVRAYREKYNDTIFCEPNNTIDVLYVGHSRVRYGVSPMDVYEEYGITSYGCSQSIQMPWEAYDFILDILKYQTLKVVALEVDQFFYNIKKAELRSDIKRTFLSIWPFFETHTYWKDGFKYPKSNPLKGFAHRTKIVPGKLNDNMNETDARVKMKKRCSKYLEKIIKLCEEKNIQVMFFALPTLLQYNYGMHNTMMDYATKYNIPFYDMNIKEDAEQIGIDWETDSFDAGDHLNYSGTVKVSKFLGAYLKENLSLPDHRGQEGYERWDEEMAQYKKIVGRVD